MCEWKAVSAAMRCLLWHRRGSWSPEGDAWGGQMGRLGHTSLSILTLEVYYRHLPLYRREMALKKDEAK